MNRFTKLDGNFQVLPDNAAEHPFVRDNRQQLIFAVASLSEDDEVSQRKAEQLAAECRLGGKDDWRLPTVEELFLIADRTKFDPAIDDNFFPDTKSDWYWTSTAAASSAEYAWFVNFDDGDANYDHRDYSNGFVRAVRSVVPAGQ